MTLVADPYRPDGEEWVKSVTAICTRLPTRVRTLRHGFNLVRKCMSVVLVTAGFTEFFQPQDVDCKLPPCVHRWGIQIDYVASNDGSRQRKSCHKSLQPVQKYRVWDSGCSPNELMQGSILVVRKSGVTIVCVCEQRLKERLREQLIKKGARPWIKVSCVPINTTNPKYRWLSCNPRSHTLPNGRVGRSTSFHKSQASHTLVQRT
ncbi:hypothetical protein PIB30_009923 [Stylosanthes scabra]|uniref:Uncharacterized protein n=1 Tax=Stylosanthes scabra TaxID=79078 RepID=A0ABU6S572_9FABA|nr:hypothetical protein [Stylosanthes scabra]